MEINEFIFVIPLKTFSTKMADGWKIDLGKTKTTLENLDRTLLSIDNAANQFDENLTINVFISGHENPFDQEFFHFLKNVYEKINIKFICNDFNRPADKNEYMKDKRRKKHSALKALYETTAHQDEKETFLMFIDADDLVSSNFLIRTIELFRENDCDDIALVSGYVFDHRNKVCGFLDGKKKLFYRNCGSSFISRISGRDLEKDGILYKLGNHVRFPEIAENHNRNVYFCFDPMVLWLVNHGQNDASERHGDQRMINFVKQYRCDHKRLLPLNESFPFLYYKT